MYKYKSIVDILGHSTPNHMPDSIYYKYVLYSRKHMHSRYFSSLLLHRIIYGNFSEQTLT